VSTNTWRVLIRADDHLDRASIKAIEGLREGAKYFVPVGTGIWFTRAGIDAERVFELDWWQAVNLAFTESGLEVLRGVGGVVGTPTLDDGVLYAKPNSMDTAGHFGRRRLSVEIEDDTSQFGADLEMPVKDAGDKDDQLTLTNRPALGVNKSSSRPISSRLTITCTPAQHVDGRDFFFRDKGTTRCATWVIEQHALSSAQTCSFQGGRVFFGGDTGYRACKGGPAAPFIQGKLEVSCQTLTTGRLADTCQRSVIVLADSTSP
jgi:hypothetical protein